MSDYTFTLLTPKKLVVRWKEVRPLLQRAVVHNKGELIVDDVIDLVWQGKMFVAVLEEDEKILLVVAAEVIYFPKRKVMNLVLVGGTGTTILREQFHERLLQMAKTLEVQAIRCYCRDSVMRLLQRLDLKITKAYNVLELEVSK